MSRCENGAVVIGSSAGAVEALLYLLPRLPAGFACPVMVVVHMPSDGKSLLADLLDTRCVLHVKEAEDKEMALPGMVYIAPPDYHLLVERNGCLSLSSEEPELYSRPCINMLFETAADAFGSSLIGIILTGGNEDGAAGLAAIVAAGGRAIVQDPQDASYPHMPQAALKACPDAEIRSLTGIAEFLCGDSAT